MRDQWKDIYPELVNKLRWAICTAVKTPESNYPYGVAQRIATVLAQDAVAIIQLGEEHPEILSSPASIRGVLKSLDIERDVDSILTPGNS